MLGPMRVAPQKGSIVRAEPYHFLGQESDYLLLAID
jgi:hypothetical protein